MDRDVCNTFKSIMTRHGQNVKENLVSYVQSVIKYGILDADTISATREAEDLKKDPDGKVYNSFSELLKDVGADKDEQRNFKYHIVSVPAFKKDIKTAKKTGL